MEVKTLIIPDIHGRTFWKEDTEKFLNDNENGVIVFLGDYLDPYKGEDNENKISQESSIINLKEIIEFKKNHDNVILLTGNHDLPYIFYEFDKCSRYDRWRAPKITRIFIDNIRLFNIAFKTTSGGKNFILSHAGIQKNWVESYFSESFKIINDVNVAEFMNAQFDDKKTNPSNTFIYALNVMSKLRGGFFDNHGSMVWADCLEYLRPDTEIYGDFQIFGHTQLEKPFIYKNFACLDCRQSFILTDGVITYTNGEPVEITEKIETEL